MASIVTTTTTLRARAKTLGIPRYSVMARPALLKALKKAATKAAEQKREDFLQLLGLSTQQKAIFSNGWSIELTATQKDILAANANLIPDAINVHIAKSAGMGIVSGDVVRIIMAK